MFSGIVEAKSVITAAEEHPGRLQVIVEKPKHFKDIGLGDSICCDGVCLTVEEQSADQMQFSLAAETLHITGWKADNLLGREVNLERSLRMGDRIHGHLVTGHVDGMGEVSEVSHSGESLIFGIQFPQWLSAYIWRKGSVAVNGVSLTVNEAGPTTFSICLIPETLKRTNLGQLQKGSPVTLEVDNMARGLLRQREQGGANGEA